MTRRPLFRLGLLAAGLLLLAPRAHAAHVEYHDGLPVVYLSGTPREIGRQHGELLRHEVRESVRQLLGYFYGYVKIPGVRVWLVNWWLDQAWRQAQPYVPADYLEELQGLSETSGVPLKDLYRLHAIPDRTYSCSNFAAWGDATRDGRLIHMRNLDWNIGAGIQRHAVIFVVRPEGKRPFVSVGWAGLIAVLTGINDAQLSVGQIGAETTDVTFAGEPMAFIIRRILEEAGTVDEAAALVQQARRTVGINYLVADAKARRAIAVETTHRYAKVFEANDPAEQTVSYARPVPDAVFRADTAIDPAIRERQIASGGQPQTPGLEPPSGSAYEKRYLGQAEGIKSHYGQLTPEAAIDIARAVAPSSNVQSVIFAWPEMWVANARGAIPAAQTPYHRFNVEELLR